MKAILAIILVFFLLSTLPYTPAAKGLSPALDNTLVVCVGAHPDDIDIGISGALYKHDIGKHPILWLVVTDGGADLDEYEYESNSSRNWIAKDGQFTIAWKAADGTNVTRPFYSADLAKKRCGGYFEGLNWKEEVASHNSSFGVEYDWRTRVSNFVGPTIEKIQLSYLDPSDPTKRLTYPDGALANAEIAYTNSIAMNLASEITKLVESNGYQKSLIKTYSHATEEVCTNANEHPDHRVTGNAVRQAIHLLHENYGFGQIDSNWFTVYSPIDPKLGYLKIDDDISQQKTQKSELAKACWETDAAHSKSINFTWKDYPYDPGQYEYTVFQNCYAPSLTPHLVVRGSDNVIYYRTYSAYPGGAWGSWYPIASATGDSPAAAMLGNYLHIDLHIVARNMAGTQIWHGYVNLATNAFSGWTLISGNIISKPTLTSNGTALSLVVRGYDNRLWYRTYSGGVWGSWYPIASATGDSPAAAMLGNNLHIVARDMSGTQIWHGYVNLATNAFSGWTLISGNIISAPTLTSNGVLLSLVVRGYDNQVWYRTYSGGVWGSWYPIASATGDSPAAAMLGNNLHIVARDMSGTQIWHGYVNLATNAFSGWTLISGSPVSAPTLTS